MIFNAKSSPFDLDAERSILACLLLADCWKQIKLEPDDFYHKPHREIFLVIREKINSRESVDVVSVKDTLKCRGSLEMIGGAGFLAELITQDVSMAMLGMYAKTVKDKSQFRRLIQSRGEVSQE